MTTTLAIKVDVDTERGTRLGVPALCSLFRRHNIPATFLFSLGPDNTGRALKRVFRPGFLKKVGRTSVLKVYGLRTLLNGVLLPGPHIAKYHGDILRSVKKDGHEVGIHCYDHVYWQDYLHSMTAEQVYAEVQKAQEAFLSVFGEKAKTAGTAGWQANAHSLQAYDDQGFIYGSDTRGHSAFYPRIGECVYKTLQLPTTLPTFDELYGRPEYPLSDLAAFYLKSLKPNKKLNVLTIHAELEGMAFYDWFETLILKLRQNDISFVSMLSLSEKYTTELKMAETCPVIQREIDGRSGLLAYQEKGIKSYTQPDAQF